MRFRDSGSAWFGENVGPLGGGLGPSIKDGVPKDYCLIPRRFGDDSTKGLPLKYSDATEEQGVPLESVTHFIRRVVFFVCLFCRTGGLVKPCGNKPGFETFLFLRGWGEEVPSASRQPAR